MGELVNKEGQTTKVNCSKCGGTGTINTETCSTCNGSGQVELLKG